MMWLLEPQPYGIKVWGDLLGTLTAVGIYGILTGLHAPSKFRKWYWIGQFIISAYGSLTILPRALYRMDPATFVYHLTWVVAQTWLIAVIWKPSWDESLTRFDAWKARLGVWVIDAFARREGGEHERL